MGIIEEFSIGHLVLQPNRQLLDGRQRLPLGSKALALISVLAKANGEIVTKDELMEAVWSGLIVEENAIQVHVAALRKLMGAAAENLITIRGIGYRLEMTAPDNTTVDMAASSAPASAAPNDAESILAVLPFDNLSSDPELLFFCDGVSEEILRRITRGSMLTVIGRTTSFQFRGATKAQAATILKSTHILDGSIQRSGTRIRISAHLLDCATKTNLWSQSYDRDLEDIFAVQDDIAEAIADALKSKFEMADIVPIKPAIYDLYLRAKDRVSSVAAMERNVSSLEKVTQMADGFAAGWATLAYRKAELLMHCPYERRAALRSEIGRDIARCDALDPGHPDAMAAKWMLMPPFGSLLGQQAILNSNTIANRDFVDFLTSRAYFLEGVGRSNDAVEQAERAALLDPLNPFAVGLHSQALWFAGRYEEARSALDQVRQKWPDSHHSVAVLIQACVHLQDWAMVDHLIQARRLAIYPLREHVGVIAFARVMRDPTQRNRRLMFDTICKRANSTGYVDAQVAVIAAELGFVDETFAMLDRCHFGPSGAAQDVMGTHAYRTLLLFPKAYPALRNDPRFVKICARLGLVEYWLETQKWPDCASTVPYDFESECALLRNHPKDLYIEGTVNAPIREAVCAPVAIAQSN